MTKRETLDSFVLPKEQNYFRYTYMSIEKAMDKYAEQEAIGFAEYCINRTQDIGDDMEVLWQSDFGKWVSTTELYQLYLKSK